MLDKLIINDFKCHKSTEITLKNFNLLVGTNSSGKSSVIQALLLMSHSISNTKGSALNGHLVSVGRNNEVGCPDLEIRSRIPRCARDWDSSETQKNYIDWGADDQQVLDIVNEDTRTRLDKSDVRDEVGLAGV